MNSLAREWFGLHPGEPADLVMLDADPLADIENIRTIYGVMAEFDNAEMLCAGAERAHAALPNSVASWIKLDERVILDFLEP